MGNMTCTTCGDYTDSREAMVCRRCGSATCSACAQKQGYLCNHCYSDLNYTN